MEIEFWSGVLGTLEMLLIVACICVILLFVVGGILLFWTWLMKDGKWQMKVIYIIGFVVVVASCYFGAVELGLVEKHYEKMMELEK